MYLENPQNVLSFKSWPRKKGWILLQISNLDFLLFYVKFSNGMFCSTYLEIIWTFISSLCIVFMKNQHLNTFSSWQVFQKALLRWILPGALFPASRLWSLGVAKFNSLSKWNKSNLIKILSCSLTRGLNDFTFKVIILLKACGKRSSFHLVESFRLKESMRAFVSHICIEWFVLWIKTVTKGMILTYRYVCVAFLKIYITYLLIKYF